MKVLLTGATGMIGKGVLYECLESEKIEEVVLLSRRKIDVQHNKINEVIADDFLDLHAVKEAFKHLDACFHCMGVSAAGMNEEGYTRLTYDVTTHLAELFLEQIPGSAFIYVSGQGTDSSGRGRVMWARVKGRTENALLAMDFKGAYMFRPGVIVPKKGVKSSTTLYAVLIVIFKPLMHLMNAINPNSLTTSVKIGKAMIVAAEGSHPSGVFGPREINQLSAEI